MAYKYLFTILIVGAMNKLIEENSGLTTFYPKLFKAIEIWKEICVRGITLNTRLVEIL